MHDAGGGLRRRLRRRRLQRQPLRRADRRHYRRGRRGGLCRARRRRLRALTPPPRAPLEDAARAVGEDGGDDADAELRGAASRSAGGRSTTRCRRAAAAQRRSSRATRRRRGRTRRGSSRRASGGTASAARAARRSRWSAGWRVNAGGFVVIALCPFFACASFAAADLSETRRSRIASAPASHSVCRMRAASARLAERTQRAKLGWPAASAQALTPCTSTATVRLSVSTSLSIGRIFRCVGVVALALNDVARQPIAADLLLRERRPRLVAAAVARVVDRELDLDVVT